MKFSSMFAAVTFGLVAMASQAAPIKYEGPLTAGNAVTGSVGGFGWIDDDAPNVDFWSFSGRAGSIISLLGSRLNQSLDLALTLYQGTTTTDDGDFIHNGNFGGLTFLRTADDEIEVPGPFGDPALAAFTLPFSGNYTIAIGGSLSDGAGPFNYRLTLQQVPTPETAPLLAIGVAALALGIRRRGW